MDNTVGSQQRDIIIGTLLGDGFLERNGKNVRLIVDHSLAQEKYVSWKQQQLSGIPSAIAVKHRKDIRTGVLYSHCILRTHSLPLFEEYAALFYKEKRKRIPCDLPIILSPQMFAVWVMDDGYKRSDCNALRLNTQSYSYEEQGIIQKALHQFGIESTIQKHKNAYVIYIPSRSMERVRSLIRPHIIPSMEYKIA